MTQIYIADIVLQIARTGMDFVFVLYMFCIVAILLTVSIRPHLGDAAAFSRKGSREMISS